MWVRPRAPRIMFRVEGSPSAPAISWVFPTSLICGSDDDRANLMWKRYLEREDSKIVGMKWDRKHGGNEWGWAHRLGKSKKQLTLLKGVRTRLNDEKGTGVEYSLGVVVVGTGGPDAGARGDQCRRKILDVSGVQR